MSGLAMSKPWARLTAEAIAAVPAQLGVYQIADGDQTILRIGYAGGREPFVTVDGHDQVVGNPEPRRLGVGENAGLCGYRAERRPRG